MGAVEHLKTLCCLGLPPESAMIAVVPLLHEIVPHGASRMALLEPDATLRGGCSENPATTAVIRERFWRFVKKQCLYSKYYPDSTAFQQAILSCIHNAPMEHQAELNQLLT